MNHQPPDFEDDDRLRSDFIRRLTLAQLEHEDSSTASAIQIDTEAIPRTLVRYWNDPYDIPPDVRECLDSWEMLRDEGFSIKLFGDASARSYIAKRYGRREIAAFDRCRHPAMRSDYLRLCFVLAEGGLYVDADDVLVSGDWKKVFGDPTLKVQPLCYDIRIGGMIPAEQIRQRNLSTANRIFYVNNNPIAAPANHPVLWRALSRATEKLLGKDPAPEIQSTTGPGNLTASLAGHANECHTIGARQDFTLLLDWEDTAQTCWDLEYRADSRNWRNMDTP